MRRFDFRLQIINLISSWFCSSLPDLVCLFWVFFQQQSFKNFLLISRDEIRRAGLLSEPIRTSSVWAQDGLSSPRRISEVPAAPPWRSTCSFLLSSSVSSGPTFDSSFNLKSQVCSFQWQNIKSLTCGACRTLIKHLSAGVTVPLSANTTEETLDVWRNQTVRVYTTKNSTVNYRCLFNY